MVKTLTFGDKQVQFSTSFAWAFAYKSQFGADPAKIFMPAIKKIMLLGADKPAENDEQAEEQAIILYEEMGFTGIQSFGDDFEALTIVTELIPDAIESCFTSKNLETPSPKELKEEPEEKAEK